LSGDRENQALGPNGNDTFIKAVAVEIPCRRRKAVPIISEYSIKQAALEAAEKNPAGFDIKVP
jgi:hypothetical protein